MSKTHTEIQARTYTMTINIDNSEIFETTTSVYREIILKGTRGAIYTSERNLGSSTFRFWTETPGRRNRLPSIRFDGQYFTIDNGTLREATYQEAKAGLAASKTFRAL